MGLDELFGLVHLGGGEGPVHDDVGHFFVGLGGGCFVELVDLVLEDERTTMGEDDVLEDVYGSLSSQLEHAFLEQLLLLLLLVHSLIQLLHFGRVSKLSVNHILSLFKLIAGRLL